MEVAKDGRLASSGDRAATPSGPSPSVSGIAGIPDARNTANAIAPLPSFIRASSTDAGNMSMRKAGRTRWNDDDWNKAVEVQNRLVLGCYGHGRGANRPEYAFYRFQIAEQLERAGKLNSNSNIAAEIDAVLDGAASAGNQVSS